MRPLSLKTTLRSVPLGRWTFVTWTLTERLVWVASNVRTAAPRGPMLPAPGIESATVTVLRPPPPPPPPPPDARAVVVAAGDPRMSPQRTNAPALRNVDGIAKLLRGHGKGRGNRSG